MEQQTVRLFYKDGSNWKFDFKNPHGAGKIVAVSDYELTDSLEINTGISFMLVSSDPEIPTNGFYYQALPAINPELQLTPIVPGGAAIAAPFVNVVCTTPYNLEKPSSGNKETLSLTLFAPGGVPSGYKIVAGDVLCYISFPVVFDFYKAISCVKRS